jgi:hypothetical protein
LRRSEVVKGVLRGATQRALVRAEHHWSHATTCRGCSWVSEWVSEWVREEGERKKSQPPQPPLKCSWVCKISEKLKWWNSGPYTVHMFSYLYPPAYCLVPLPGATTKFRQRYILIHTSTTQYEIRCIIANPPRLTSMPIIQWRFLHWSRSPAVVPILEYFEVFFDRKFEKGRHYFARRVPRGRHCHWCEWVSEWVSEWACVWWESVSEWVSVCVARECGEVTLECVSVWVCECVSEVPLEVRSITVLSGSLGGWDHLR